METKTILITGSNGFIGNNLIKYFTKKEINVAGVDVYSTEKIVNIESIPVYSKDLVTESIDDIISYYKPFGIVHCAGSANVGLSIKDPDTDFKRNVIITQKILNSLVKSNINTQFLFLSSAAVYGNPKVLPIDEFSTLNPISPYGLHKKLCEEMCLFYSNHYNLNVKICRIFSAYGVGLRKQLFWDMFEKLRRTNKLVLYGTGNETRDFIYIDDIAQAIDLILENGHKGKIYNIASGYEYKISEIASIFVEEFGLDNSVIKFNNKSKVGDPERWRANIDNLLELGFKQTIDINSGIKKYIEWVQKNG